MRHLELRDLWLQREVGEGRLLVRKVAGEKNPADAMTKFLTRAELQSRLQALNLELKWQAQSGSGREPRGGVGIPLAPDALSEDPARIFGEDPL